MSTVEIFFPQAWTLQQCVDALARRTSALPARWTTWDDPETEEAMARLLPLRDEALAPGIAYSKIVQSEPPVIGRIYFREGQ